MKYKIEIWKWGRIVSVYENDNIESVLSWYMANWQWCYECGNCSFDIYQDGKELDFDEEIKLGFY